MERFSSEVGTGSNEKTLRHNDGKVTEKPV